jgi:hypothetical protein
MLCEIIFCRAKIYFGPPAKHEFPCSLLKPSKEGVDGLAELLHRDAGAGNV